MSINYNKPLNLRILEMQHNINNGYKIDFNLHYDKLDELLYKLLILEIYYNVDINVLYGIKQNIEKYYYEYNTPIFFERTNDKPFHDYIDRLLLMISLGNIFVSSFRSYPLHWNTIWEKDKHIRIYTTFCNAEEIEEKER